MRKLHFHELTRDERMREARRVIVGVLVGRPRSEQRRIVRVYAWKRWGLGKREAEEAESEAIWSARDAADRRLTERLGRGPYREEVNGFYLELC